MFIKNAERRNNFQPQIIRVFQEPRILESDGEKHTGYMTSVWNVLFLAFLETVKFSRARALANS